MIEIALSLIIGILVGVSLALHLQIDKIIAENKDILNSLDEITNLIKDLIAIQKIGHRGALENKERHSADIRWKHDESKYL